jgi:hypothetical protein
LDGLPIISEDLANALAQHRGSIYMRGVKTISCDAALAISKLSGHYSLCMSGLVELTDSTGHLALATKLGKYRRDSFLAGTPWFLGNSFNNLESLSEEAALRLAQAGGKLGFNPALLPKEILRILRDGGCRTSN